MRIPQGSLRAKADTAVIRGSATIRQCGIGGDESTSVADWPRTGMRTQSRGACAVAYMHGKPQLPRVGGIGGSVNALRRCCAAGCERHLGAAGTLRGRFGGVCHGGGHSPRAMPGDGVWTTECGGCWGRPRRRRRLSARAGGALPYRFRGAQHLQLIPLVPQQAPTTQLTTSVAPKPVHVPEKVRLTLFELSPLLKLAGPFSIGKRSLQSRKVL